MLNALLRGSAYTCHQDDAPLCTPVQVLRQPSRVPAINEMHQQRSDLNDEDADCKQISSGRSSLGIPYTLLQIGVLFTCSCRGAGAGQAEAQKQYQSLGRYHSRSSEIVVRSDEYCKGSHSKGLSRRSDNDGERWLRCNCGIMPGVGRHRGISRGRSARHVGSWSWCGKDMLVGRHAKEPIFKCMLGFPNACVDMAFKDVGEIKTDVQGPVDPGAAFKAKEV